MIENRVLRGQEREEAGGLKILQNKILCNLYTSFKFIKWSNQWRFFFYNFQRGYTFCFPILLRKVVVEYGDLYWWLNSY